jgi:hypothetical protein
MEVENGMKHGNQKSVLAGADDGLGAKDAEEEKTMDVMSADQNQPGTGHEWILVMD